MDLSDSDSVLIDALLDRKEDWLADVVRGRADMVSMLRTLERETRRSTRGRREARHCPSCEAPLIVWHPLGDPYGEDREAMAHREGCQLAHWLKVFGGAAEAERQAAESQEASQDAIDARNLERLRALSTL